MVTPRIIVVGASAGGLSVLEKIISSIDVLPIPLVIVQHISPDSGDSVLRLLKKYSSIPFTEPIDKEGLEENHIYLAPPDYHVMIEHDKSFSLYLGPKENFCRPAIDLLFETAAEVYKDGVLGIILTGANRDGLRGCQKIKLFHGTVIAQNPEEAQVPVMPKAVVSEGLADHVLNIDEICIMINSVLKGVIDG
ncbi:MAG: chemotaxis protein CheB [Spirochaetales bacterium]|nr:chemotaxis protein CheB [Spirochaetales bacterium]